MKLSIIVAEDKHHAIGHNNQLLFHLPQDMKRFKALTTGHTIIMGRKTFESLPKGALPNRRNIVLTRNEDLKFTDAECFTSLEQALQNCHEEEEVFIIGGETVFRTALPLSNKIYLTQVDSIVTDADAFFPKFKKTEWIIKNSEAHPKDEKHRYPYTFIDLEKRSY
jgi:dihydrofolate reductase